MEDINKKIDLIFGRVPGISILIWHPIECSPLFYRKKRYRISDWSKYIGRKVKDITDQIPKKGVHPISIDKVYVHGLAFYPKKKEKEILPLLDLFTDWYFGVYLKNAYQHSLELRKSINKIIRYKSPRKIIDGFGKALVEVFGGDGYEILHNKKIKEVHASGSLTDLKFYLPLISGDVTGILISKTTRILPNEVSIKYLEGIISQVQIYLHLQSKMKNLGLVVDRYQFLGKFSEYFHTRKDIGQFSQFFAKHLPSVLDVEQVEFYCQGMEKLTEERGLDTEQVRKKGYLERRVGGRSIYRFPIFHRAGLAALLRLTSKTSLDKDDLGFLKFLMDEIGFMIDLHAAEKGQEMRMRELETAYEVSSLYPLLSSPADAYGMLTEKICKKTGFDVGGFVIAEGENFVVKKPGVGLENFTEDLTIKINDTEVMYSVFHSRKPFFSNRIEDQSFITKKVAAKFEITKFICIPLLFKSEAIGLFVAGRKPDSPEITDEDQRLMTILVSQAAVLIQGLQSCDNLSLQIQELRLINEISRIANSTLYLNEIVRLSLHKLRSFITHPYLSLFIYNEFSNNLELVGYLGYHLPDSSYRFVKPGIGIVGNAAMIRAVIVVNDVHEDNRYIKMLDDVNSELAIPIIFQEKLLGIIDIQSPTQDAFKPDEIGLLGTVTNQLASAIENAQLHERVEETLTDAVRALVMTIDAADPYTRGHSERVTDYAVQIATELALPHGEVEKIKKAALLHDIGKIGISELILLKKEKLSSEEMDEVKLHPLLGAQMLDGVKGFEEVRNLIKSHHEGYNGDGYPYGLRGEEIPLGARIITIADVYEALTSDRPYRPAYSKSQAIEILKSEAGGHLDPKIVSVLIRILNRKE